MKSTEIPTQFGNKRQAPAFSNFWPLRMQQGCLAAGMAAVGALPSVINDSVNV
jgi:hypothetical protein